MTTNSTVAASSADRLFDAKLTLGLATQAEQDAKDRERRSRARLIAAGGRHHAPQATVDAWVNACDAKFRAHIAVLRARVHVARLRREARP